MEREKNQQKSLLKHDFNKLVEGKKEKVIYYFENGNRRDCLKCGKNIKRSKYLFFCGKCIKKDEKEILKK